MNRTLLIGLGLATIGGGIWYWYSQKEKYPVADMQDEVVTPEEPGMGLGTPRPAMVKPGIIQANQAVLKMMSQYYR